MTKVALSEFKAKMSYYLRMVRSGEELELLDRGVSVAKVAASLGAEEDLVIKPKAAPQKMHTVKFTAKLKSADFDVVSLLTEDRSKR